MPRLDTNFRRLKVQQLDLEASYLDFSEVDNDDEVELEEVCNVLDGGDPDADLRKYIGCRPIESIRKALILAYKELNEILLDSIDLLLDEAIDLGITIEEDDLQNLRSETFLEEEETRFMSNVKTLEKAEAVNLVVEARCELAWFKDNRNRLIDYVEEAKSIRDADGSHEFKFEWYGRATEIEILENEEREWFRGGWDNKDVAKEQRIGSGAGSPTKRKRSVRLSVSGQATGGPITDQDVQRMDQSSPVSDITITRDRSASRPRGIGLDEGMDIDRSDGE